MTTLQKMSVLTDQKIGAWVKIQEKMAEDEKKRESGPVSMVCVGERTEP